jgi:two-component system, sensor histidine kinase RegB
VVHLQGFEQLTMHSDRIEQSRRDGIQFSWLVKLRWAAMAGQLVTIAVVHEAMGIQLRLAPLLVLMGLGLTSNVVALALVVRGKTIAPWAIPAVMIFDTLLLTALLYLTGGPFNPFSFLYLVQIALAAVLLPPRFTWTLVVVSLACSAFLFLGYEELPLPRMSHAEHMRIHLVGMWVAFGVAAGFIVYFLLRITRALAARDGELDAARTIAAKQEKLASLATLAAGTAHELATPLSTIALVARELDRELADPALYEAARADAKLIRAEVQRCRAILDRMSVRGGEFAPESIGLVDLSHVVDDALAQLAKTPHLRVDLGTNAEELKLQAPPKALSLTLQNLLKNAQEASKDGEEVVISATQGSSRVWIEVRDRGVGMPKEVLERIGEPFFTTKAPGSGMGLGVFVSRAMVERLGGRLSVTSEPTRGTCVTFDLPMGPLSNGRIVPPS